jgi:hypothetical protein
MQIREQFLRFLREDAKRTIAEGARLFGLNPRTARCIWDKACSPALQQASWGGSRNSKLTGAHFEALAHMVDARPDITLQQLQTRLLGEFGVNVTSKTISTALTKIGFTFKLLRPIPESRNTPETIESRHQYARAFMETGPINQRDIIWVDEVGFNLHLRRTHGRARRGQLASMVVPNGRGRNISIAAAMSEDGFLYHKINMGAYNAVLFMAFLEELFVVLQQHGRSVCWIVLDNVRFHHTSAVTAFVRERGHELKFLPPYSPMLNPIESLFSKWKALVRSQHVAFDQQTLLENIEDAAREITNIDCLGWIRDVDRNLSLCLLNNVFI